jgi:DNA primase
MGPFIDFARIKAEVTIIQVLEMLEVTHLKPHGDMLRGHCPTCQEGNDRSFVVTPAKNAFYCFAALKGGDIIELVSLFHRIPQKQAAERIAARFGIGDVARRTAEEGRPVEAEPVKPAASGFDPKAYQASLDPAHPALKEAGFREETIRDFDGGFCSRGLHRGRLVLPVHDGRGVILGFMGLALKGERPDVLYPKGFDPGVVPFFNLHRVGKGTLYLVQTPRDVLRAWDANLLDVVCPLVPLTPGLLEVLVTAMRELGCEVVEVY